MLIDDVDPSGLPPGPTMTQPAPVGPTTVRLPVTATASSGTAPRPVAWSARTTFVPKAPASPFATRLSRTRDASIPKNVAPEPSPTK